MLSKNRMQEEEGYEEQTFEAVPAGANNPFLQEQTESYNYTADGRRIAGEQGQYYGAGYSQAQSGYSSSGFGKERP